MKRNYLVRIIAFLMILCTVLFSINKVFEFKFIDGIYGLKTFYELPDDSVDVLVLGSSHAFMDINPAVLWKDKGISAYDLCGSAQPLWNSYYYLKEALKTQSPQLIILEGLGTLFADNYLDDSRIIKNNFGLKLSADKIESLKASTSKDRLLEFGLEYIQSHNRYKELTKEDFLPYQNNENYYRYWKGFYGSMVTIAQERPNISDVTDTIELHEKTEEYYRKIIELAQDNDIPIVVVISPSTTNNTEQSFFNDAEKIAKEYGVSFVNGHLLYDAIGVDFSTDFADVSHLNFRGSEKWSGYLANYIKKNYHITDRRGDGKYASWEKNSYYYEQMLADQALRETTDTVTYFDLLQQSNSLTYVVSLDGNYIVEGYDINTLLNCLDISDDGNKAWVMQEKQIVFSDWEYSDDVFHTNLGTDYLAVIKEKETETQKIVYNNIDQKKVVNGINIFVYNNYTGTHVETIGFDADNNYAIIR